MVNRSLITRRTAAAGILAGAFSNLPFRGATAQDMRFGLIIPSADNYYYALMISGAREASARLNVQLLVIAYNYEVARATQEINELISSKIDGLIIAASINSVSGEFLPSTRRALDAGIPIVTIGFSLPGESGHVSPDLAAAGQLQANIVTTLVHTGTPSIIYLTRVDQTAAAAFKNAIKTTVVQVVVPYVNDEETRERIHEAIESHSASIIVASDDALTLNTIALLSTAGPPRTVIGLGASPDDIEALKRGLLTATIDLRPRDQGVEGVETLVSAKQSPCPNGQNPPCPPRSRSVQPVAIIGPSGRGAN